MIRTTSTSQTEILTSIRTLHCPNGFECDLTYGNGSFWKEIGDPVHCLDVQPLKPHVTQSCSTKTPFNRGQLNNVVFDPPFITYVQNGRSHSAGKMIMSRRFGGYHTYNDLEDHYGRTIIETHRILKKKGVLIFKCQDIVHNHRLHCTHGLVIKLAEDSGFRLLDMFVLLATSRLPHKQSGVQRHARIWHSFFVVFVRDSSP